MVRSMVDQLGRFITPSNPYHPMVHCSLDGIHWDSLKGCGRQTVRSNPYHEYHHPYESSYRIIIIIIIQAEWTHEKTPMVFVFVF